MSVRCFKSPEWLLAENGNTCEFQQLWVLSGGVGLSSVVF